MALGLLTGRSEPGAPVDDHYSQVQELVSQFADAFGSINCQELTGVHLGTEEGQMKFREVNQIESCLTFAEQATRVVVELAGNLNKT
jgi:hypothetical protein